MRKNYALDMTCGPFFKKILIFSVPLMLTGLLQLAYNTADVVVVGRFVGKEALAAVGLDRLADKSLCQPVYRHFDGLGRCGRKAHRRE